MDSPGGVIGPALKKCLEQFNKLLETSGPILLIGEPGSGKDHLVKLIHHHVLRKPELNFQVQNCARPQQILLEELCGRVNEQDEDNTSIWDNSEVIISGKLDLASQGTLYLDHVHLTPPDGIELIVNILTGLPFYPKGSSTPRLQENIRIVASCIPHPFDGELGYLPERIRGYFSNRLVIIPNLAHRKEEIRDLVYFFCTNEFTSSTGNIPAYDIEQELIENADRIFDNIKGLKAIVKRFINQNPQGGNITWMLASEYLERKNQQQSVDEQRRYRCTQLSFNLRYQGELLNGDKLYSWIRQFDLFQGQLTCNPIDIGETLLKHICERYFFTEAKIISLVKDMLAT